jgi:putative oxidoreductase
MNKFFDDKFDLGLLVIRIGLGIMFIFHGAPKLFSGPDFWEKIGGAMGNFGIHFLPAFWGFMAAVAEFGGGIALILGAAFRPMMAMLVINLAVASVSHFARGQGLNGASHAIEDGIVFLGLIFIGAGKYTIYWLLKPWRPASPPVIDNNLN